MAQTGGDSILINKRINSNLNSTNVSDSIKERTGHYNSADFLRDSVNAEYSRYSSKITKTTNRYKAKIDSLKAKGQPHDSYSKKLDSLNAMSSFDTWQQKQNGLTNKPQDKLNKLKTSAESGVNDKIAILSKESGGKGNIPAGANIPNVDTGLDKAIPNLPNIDRPDLALPSGKGLGTDVSLDTNIKIPDNPGDKINVGKGDLPNVDIPKVDMPKADIPDVGVVTDKATAYSKDIQQVKEGDLSKVDEIGQDAVSKLPVDDEMKVIKDGDKVIADQKAMVESMKNPEEYKKQTLARAKQMATKQLATHQEVVQKVVNKASAYQKTAGTLMVKRGDLPKRRDPLKKLKTYERLVPGITVQIQKPGAWLVDFNPSLRYRITSYWSAGTGWNERVIFGKYNQTREQARMYGVRGFTEVVVFKGLALRLDGERVNTFVLPATLNQDLGSREWVWNYMAGIKKEFTFMPKVVANVQFMYNLYDPGDRMAYANRINIRFGFEFPLKDCKKSTSKQDNAK